MAVTTIRYGETSFYTEAPYDEVYKALADGEPLDVHIWERGQFRKNLRITFFGDPDWISVEL